mgnify:CR=1 FL=1
MERLIVLGTGNAQATHCYNTCYAMQKGEEYFLVDAGGGNGILSQLDKAGIPLESIHNIFVTHAHNDHILGMVWMIRMLAPFISILMNVLYFMSLHMEIRFRFLEILLHSLISALQKKNSLVSHRLWKMD